jgi:hypothetical protein
LTRRALPCFSTSMGDFLSARLPRLGFGSGPVE